MLLSLLLLVAPLAWAHSPSGTPKAYCEPAVEHVVHDYGQSNSFGAGPRTDGAAAIPCQGLTLGDGHYEFASGGAHLQSGGSAAGCLPAGAVVDHDVHPRINVWDETLSNAVGEVWFEVWADMLNNLPPSGGPNCGDGLVDYGTLCKDVCTPTFPPGLDGEYWVFVYGTHGHIWEG